MSKVKTDQPPEGENPALFTKEQMLGSAKYAGRADLLRALLKDGEPYTAAQVDEMIKKYDGRKM